jgi:hypothetical protein
MGVGTKPLNNHNSPVEVQVHLPNRLIFATDPRLGLSLENAVTTVLKNGMLMGGGDRRRLAGRL